MRRRGATGNPATRAQHGRCASVRIRSTAFVPPRGSETVSVIAAFPKRSMQFSRIMRSGRWTKLTWGLIPALWLSWLFANEIRPLWDEYRLHDSGAVARATEVSNVQRYNSRSNHNIDFDLRYVTEDGTSHNTHVEFDSSWVLDNMMLPIVVHHDGQHHIVQYP